MSGSDVLMALTGGLAAAGAKRGYSSATGGASAATAAPAVSTPKPLPVEDDEARRKARMAAMVKQSQAGGRQSTMLVRDKMGKDEEVETRSSILSMG